MTHLYLYICENGPLEKTSLSNASLVVIVNIAPIQCFIWGKFRGAKRAFNEAVRIALRLSVLVHVGNGNDGAHLPNQRTTLSPIRHSRCPQAQRFQRAFFHAEICTISAQNPQCLHKSLRPEGRTKYGRVCLFAMTSQWRNSPFSPFFTSNGHFVKWCRCLLMSVM